MQLIFFHKKTKNPEEILLRVLYKSIEEQAEKFEAMIERLEDLDDVQNVYHNADI